MSASSPATKRFKTKCLKTKGQPKPYKKRLVKPWLPHGRDIMLFVPEYRYKRKSIVVAELSLKKKLKLSI